MKKAKYVAASWLALGLAATPGCGDTIINNTYVVEADAGPDGGPKPVSGPCTAEQRPYEDGCFGEDGTGVFVSLAAAAGGDGTKAKPFSRLSQALAQGGRIYVCHGEYSEALVVTGDKSVTVFGGLSCESWAVDTNGSTVLTASTNEVPLTVRGQTAGFAMSDVNVVAVDATGQSQSGAGNSSIAAFVSESTDVRFTRVHFASGAGTKGADGAGGTGNAKEGLSGNPANANAGGQFRQCVCGDDTESVGGAGGNGLLPTKDGGVGTATPEAPSDNVYTGAGGTGGTSESQSCVTGRSGALGGAGTASEGFSSREMSAAGLIVNTAAATGSYGTPGQGGGGGGGKVNAPAAGGGGGGCGGCGGSGGAGGWDGGSSVGLASFQSILTLANCTIRTAQGGVGGTGGMGEAGGGGGGGGGTVGACSGGSGGHGGGGAGGNGGSGGISVGVLYKGTAPTLGGAPVDDATQWEGWQIAEAGPSGSGGAGGPSITLNERQSREGARGNDGPPALQGAVKALP